MKLMTSCGHTFNWPDNQVAPDSVRCAPCGKTVAVYGVATDTPPAAEPPAGGTPPLGLDFWMQSLRELGMFSHLVAPEVSGGDEHHYTLGWKLLADRNAASRAIEIVEHHRLTDFADDIDQLRADLSASRSALQQVREAGTIHGVTWLLIRDGHVMLERCEKKARVLGVGEWFVPGGKLEPGEVPEGALNRELREEWPTVVLQRATPLPLLEGSAVPPGPRGLFLMRPYLIEVVGNVPAESGDGVPLRWVPVAEALASPVPQVRMMVAAALTSLDSSTGTRNG